MTKIERKTQKIFAGDVPAEGNIAVFGSLAANDKAFSDDPDLIQSPAYTQGWAAAIVPDDSPPLEDMNALFNLITRQLAYLYQTGIPEYDPDTTYYAGSVCSITTQTTPPTPAQIYIALVDNPTAAPGTDPASWFVLGSDKVTPAQLQAAADTINARIDAAELSSNSVDVVGTYADLQAYNTSALTPNDIITVLVDEIQGDARSYYRWNGSSFDLIAAEPPIPPADATTPGIATLGSPNGAATFESVQALTSAVAGKLSTVSTDGTLTGDGTSQSPLSVVGDGSANPIQAQDTYYVDDKFGDDATALKERMDKKFKTLEAALLQIVEIGAAPASIIIDNWAFVDYTAGEQLPDGRWLIAINEQILTWTNDDSSHYTNIINVGSNFQMAGFDYGSGNLFIYNPQSTQQTTGGFTVQPYHGLIYNINSKHWDNTDWTAPMWIGGTTLTPGKSGGAIGGGRCKIFPNGNIVYTYAGGGVTVISPIGNFIMKEDGYGDSISNGPLQQMRFCSNKIFPSYIVSKYSGILTQDGRMFSFSGGGGTHWAYNDTYLVQSKESSTNAVILQRSLIDVAGAPGAAGTVSGYQFNWGTWASNTVWMYKNRFYNGSNPLKTLNVTSADGTGKVTGVAITEALDISESQFATGGNHHAVVIHGGLVFANKMFFNVDNFGQDTGVSLAIINLGARQDLWIPEAPTSSSGATLYFWPSRITVIGHGRTNTRLDLSTFSAGLDVRGDKSWALSYTPSNPLAVGFLRVVDQYIVEMQSNAGKFFRCVISALYDVSRTGADNCEIDQLYANNGEYKACVIKNLAQSGNATFRGCDILAAPYQSLDEAPTDTFFGCRLTVGYMASRPNSNYHDCIEIY